MNGIAAFRHIEAGGFDTGSGICAGNIKFGNAVFLDKSRKLLAGRALLFDFVKI